MGNQDEFADFFALSQIYALAIKSKEYIAPANFVSGLKLAPYGISTFESMKEKVKHLEDTQILTFLVEEMYWNDLFFSATQGNVRLLETELGRALQSALIRIPWVYSGTLYRKANSIFDDMPTELNPAETWSFLSDTPQGVCQYREFVGGPLGLLRSKEMRDVELQRTIPLSHCSDPSCIAIHPARLTDRLGRTEIARMLREVLRTDLQTSNELLRKYNKVDGEFEYYDDRNPAGLVPFIGDSFDVVELRSILVDLLSQPKGLRSQLSKTPLEKRLVGSPTGIASRMSDAECLQAILLESDSALTASMDRLIERGVIKIPASETRSARLARDSRRGWHNVACEASCYGIRLMSTVRGVPLARLKRLINDVYDAGHNASALVWRLRYAPGDTIEQKLDNYVNDHTPQEALAEHVFSNPEALEKAFEVIRYGNFQLPKTAEEEQHLVKRMMWKLGFDVPTQPLHYEKLSKTLEKLREANSRHTFRGGDGLHRIRGEAVNFFVDLEQFLGHALTFSCWMLTSDHYTSTMFSYDIGASSRELAEKLNAYQEEINSSLPIVYDPEGKSTLFPLISGFRILADYCRRLQIEPARYARPKEEYPGYVGHDRIQVFPFNHTKFFLDLTENVRTNLLSQLTETTVALETLKTAGIRNRIEHNRDDFPDQEEIASLLDGLMGLVERMLSAGLAPVSYIKSGEHQDRWSRGYVDFENYRGEVIRMPTRVELGACRLPDGNGYLIIVPSIKIGNTQELARFRIKERSRYQELWDGYPIKHFKRQDNADEAQVLDSEVGDFA